MTDTRPVRKVLEASGIRRSYTLARHQIPVLQGLDLTLRSGETVAVVGASGSGKTTMIQVLGLLDRPESGSLLVEGVDALKASGSDRARIRNSTYGFVFQFYHLVPELNALDNVLLPARIGTGTFDWLAQRETLRDRASELLESVGLENRGRHRPSQLSGGERQRVAIARALMNHPSVMFCDEPTGNLDPRTKGGIEDLLFGSVSDDRALLLVTHDERFARRCQRVLRLMEGRLVEAGAETGPEGGVR